jgi:hypothetical protein
MIPHADEMTQILAVLPAEKAQALLEYARYLAEQAETEAWDRRFHDPKYAPKLKTLMAEVEGEIAAGNTQPLDLNQL